MAVKETNYVKNKDLIIELISKSSLCHDCLARELCKHICKQEGIDPSKQNAPCKEAWKEWCDSKAV